MNYSNNNGIYIHIPYCKSKCDYCNFVSFVDFSTQKEYLNKLINEIQSRAKGEVCDTIYIGGGTPSAFFRDGLEKILDCLRYNFSISKDAEITVEANPESCDEPFLSECAKIGVNRLSLGLQSCNDHILKNAGRLHKSADFFAAFKKARDFGLQNISADLIMGLNGENEETFRATLKNLIDLSPEHISVYSLKCEQGTKLYRSGFKTDDDNLRDLYDVAVSLLAASNYYRYEVSNFARCGFESRHNAKYWTLAPYLGFGLSAHSFSQNIRRENTDSLKKYLSGNYLSNEIDVSADLKEEFIMLGLRMSQGISLKKFETRFGTSFLSLYKAKLAALLEGGYILIDGDWLKINPEHIYIMNSIVSELIC